MKNIFSKSFLILLFLSVYSSSSYALEVETHKAINKYIAQNTLNSFSLDSYLKNNLGLTKGKEEEFTSGKTRKVFEWLELGGKYEDAPPENLIPYRRSRNHFHNPLKAWDQAYYTDWLAFCSSWDNPLLISGHCPVSAILWAQGPQNSDFALGMDLNPGGDWSWKQVRSYYLNALTATDKTARNTNFANTFRGLGQLMHLIQDMSVPSHTRNDGHLFYNYEDWVDKIREKEPQVFGNFVSNPIFFGGIISGISSFFDTNQYSGANPQDILSNTVGLSEFTNANYFSDDTIQNNNPKQIHTFPYPTGQQHQ